MSAHAIFIEFTPKVKTTHPKQWSNLQSLEESAPWVYAALERISELKLSAPANGNSNGHPNEHGAARAAIRLLSLAPTTLLPEPAISATPDGGVGFHWRVGSRDLEVECGIAGRIEYLKTELREPDHEYQEGVLVDLDEKEFWAWLVEG